MHDANATPAGREWGSKTKNALSEDPSPSIGQPDASRGPGPRASCRRVRTAPTHEHARGGAHACRRAHAISSHSLSPGLPAPRTTRHPRWSRVFRARDGTACPPRSDVTYPQTPLRRCVAAGAVPPHAAKDEARSRTCAGAYHLCGAYCRPAHQTAPYRAWRNRISRLFTRRSSVSWVPIACVGRSACTASLVREANIQVRFADVAAACLLPCAVGFTAMALRHSDWDAAARRSGKRNSEEWYRCLGGLEGKTRQGLCDSDTHKAYETVHRLFLCQEWRD